VSNFLYFLVSSNTLDDPIPKVAIPRDVIPKKRAEIVQDKNEEDVASVCEVLNVARKPEKVYGDDDDDSFGGIFSDHDETYPPASSSSRRKAAVDPNRWRLKKSGRRQLARQSFKDDEFDFGDDDAKPAAIDTPARVTQSQTSEQPQFITVAKVTLPATSKTRSPEPNNVSSEPRFLTYDSDSAEALSQLKLPIKFTQESSERMISHVDNSPSFFGNESPPAFTAVPQVTPDTSTPSVRKRHRGNETSKPQKLSERYNSAKSKSKSQDKRSAPHSREIVCVDGSDDDNPVISVPHQPSWKTNSSRNVASLPKEGHYLIPSPTKLTARHNNHSVARGTSKKDRSITPRKASATRRKAARQDSGLLDVSDSESDHSLESFSRKYPPSPFGKPNKKSASTTGKRKRLSTVDGAPAVLKKLFREDAQNRSAKREKGRKKQLRKESKEERERLEEEAKRAKQMAMEDAKQRRGYYATREVCMLVDPVMMRPYSQSAAMLTKFQSSKQVKTKFPIVERSGVDPRAIQFIRCRYQDGGAVAAQKSLEKDAVSEFEVINRVLIVFDDMKDFLPLLHRDDGDDDDFPRLVAWLQTMKMAWKKQWNRATEPTVVILLNHQEADTTDDLFGNETDALIWDAIALLGILEGVECIPCPTRPVLWKFLYRMTIAISKAPYKKATTEIQCMPKIKFFKPVEGEGSTAATVGKKHKNELTVVDAYHQKRIQESWYRMLRAIPQMSAERAASVVEQYPTLRSLWWAYQDPTATTREKELLLAWKLNTTCDGRHLRKLSTHIYRLLTSDDGGEKIV
jgi:hypothetical protein